jgi:hypothetical protein
MLFFNPNPQNEVFDLLRSKNPTLQLTDAELALSNIQTDIKDANDHWDGRATLSINSTALNGSLKIDYQRIPLDRFFNDVGGAQHIPVVKVNLTPNTTYRLPDIIGVINQTLGTHFNQNPQAIDLVDQDIVTPNAGEHVDITLSAASTSILAAAGSTLKIRLKLSDTAIGAGIDTVITNHSQTPWVADGRLVPQLMMRMMDFTRELMSLTAYEVASGTISLNADTISAISPRLTAKGIPLPVDWIIITGVEIPDGENEVAAIAALTPTADLPDNPYINYNYDYVVIIPAALGNQVATATSLAGDYYFHLNVGITDVYVPA